MIDSVLKGTGNSRFLKSAVPAGTSWADALAMLQAGTFPIDFNGINTEGFQQVGTPLNKANLLKDATAAQIGLPPSTTPDGMFQALGNTGELHVWRKTTISQQAGYNLGNIVSGTFWLVSGSDQHVTYQVSASLDVSIDGTIALHSPNTVTINLSNSASNANSVLKGKFVKRTGQVSWGIPQTIVFIPNSANITKSGEIRIDSYQEVSGYPAETTTTYPVSTNPNAYQEGSDAKPAGYTLGEVVTSKVKLGYSRSSSGMFYYYADTLSVSDDGKVSISTQNSYQVNRNSSTSELKAAMAGKFIQLYGSSGSAMELSGPFSTIPGEIVFIPADTSFNTETILGVDYFTIDRYQPVTGYAAIPAGTTIEYLGKLGDKARVQVVSYVGTGTYGSSNPNSLTFDFVPKMLFVVGYYTSDCPYFMFATEKASYAHYSSQSYRLTFTLWNKTVKWYYDNADGQLNLSDLNYDAVAIG